MEGARRHDAKLSPRRSAQTFWRTYLFLRADKFTKSSGLSKLELFTASRHVFLYEDSGWTLEKGGTMTKFLSNSRHNNCSHYYLNMSSK
jgi:hypothetical protein